MTSIASSMYPRALLVCISAMIALPAIGAGSDPDPFSIAPKRGAPPGTDQVSDPFTIYGLDLESPISVSVGAFSINGAAFTSGIGTVRNGDSVRLKLTAPAEYGSNTLSVVAVGSVSSPFVVSSAARQATPDIVRFCPVIAGFPDTEYVSEAVTVSGVNAAVPVSIAGGRYSVNNGDWSSSDGQVVSGDTIRVAVVAASVRGGTASATLAVGGRSAQFTVVNEGADTVPDPFRFAGPIRGLPALGQISSAITVKGIAAPTSIVSPDGTPFQINGGVFSALPGVVNPGDKVSLYVVAGPMLNDFRSGSITIGGVSASVDVQSDAAIDQVPDAFAFRASTVPPGTEAVSSPVMVRNINTLTDIKVNGAEYNVNGGAYTSSDGQVKAGDIVTMKMLSTPGSGQAKSATLTIGSGFTRSRQATWQVTAKTPTAPASFKLANASLYPGAKVPPGSIVTTSPVIVRDAVKPVSVKVTGGFYSINGGRYVSTPGTAVNGDSVTAQMKAPAGFAESSSLKLSLGSQSSTLSVTTSTDPASATKAMFDGVTAYIYREQSPVPLRVFVAYPKDWQAQDRRAARVQFFGGGYNHGDPESAVGAAMSWAKRAGYVGFAPDYRVNDRFGSSPVSIADDNRLVVKWIMDNAAMLGVDPARVVVAGGSSAGGSAFFAGLPDPPATTAPDSSPPFPVAAISIRSGAIDVAEGDGTYASPSTNYFFPVSNEISPSRNLRPGMPPVIMIHGNADEQVPQSSAIAACNQIRRFGTRCQIKSVSGGRHRLSSSATEQADRDEEAFMTSIGVLPSLR
ncbi:MAG: hypothetical protein C0434_13250 [Xanthomonadaceae bacterium]|nr:hypothetical protein [Xanthomonadaceae bacterium]